MAVLVRWSVCGLRSLSFARSLCSEVAKPSPTAPSKALLAELRKRTGYSFSSCKKALQLCDNHLDRSVEWLDAQAQKEGWSKATKLRGRAMPYGLVSLMLGEHYGVMVEVNCETDFVAKNSMFVSFAKDVTNRCFHTLRDTTSSAQDSGSECIVKLDAEYLNKLDSGKDGRTLGDFTAIMVGKIGENMKVHQAVVIRGGDNQVAGSVHPASPSSDDNFMAGKFAALVAYTGGNNELARKIAQHIIGMNPSRIGDMDEELTIEDLEEEQRFLEESARHFVSTSEKLEESQEEGEEEVKKEEEVKPSSPREQRRDELVKQEFLLDPEFTVGEILKMNGMKILNFVRIECGV